MDRYVDRYELEEKRERDRERQQYIDIERGR